MSQHVQTAQGVSRDLFRFITPFNQVLPRFSTNYHIQPLRFSIVSPIKSYSTQNHIQKTPNQGFWRSVVDFLFLWTRFVRQDWDGVNSGGFCSCFLFHWNIVSILRDPSTTTSLTDQLYQQVRQWFLEHQVGQFLDKIRIIARAPEIARITRNPMVTIYVINIYARSRLDILARLRTIGITIIQEAPAHFEVHYSGKLRIQSTSLTVKVCSDQKLLDLLQGKISLEGILGPATITILDDDSDTVHQMELKPNKQIDRRGLPLLTNIWSTLGVSELLCTSSQFGQIWTTNQRTRTKGR